MFTCINHSKKTFSPKPLVVCSNFIQILISRKIFWNNFQFFIVVSSIIGRPSFQISSCILSEFFWFNRHIKVDNELVFLKHFSEQGISFVYQLFHKNGIAKKWEILQTGYKLDNSFISSGVSWYTLCLNSGKKASIFLKILTIFYNALIIPLPENLE